MLLANLTDLDLSQNRLQASVPTAVLRPNLKTCQLRQQHDDDEQKRFLCWDTRAHPSMSVKCGFTCGFERCDAGIRRFDSNTSTTHYSGGFD